MFKNVYEKFQKASAFEKLLLFIGLAVGIVGFWLINNMYGAEPGLTWPLIESLFLWFLLIFIIILTDSNESIKEELSLVIKEHIEETRLIKEEVALSKEETRLLKEETSLLKKEVMLLRKIETEQLKELKVLTKIRKMKR